MASANQAKLPMTAAIAATVRKVPRGRVSTYGAIAQAAGFPRGARHVARVLRQIRDLPWQRIVGSGGRIALRGEAGMEQRFLLHAENVRFAGNRVNLREFEHTFAAARPKSRVPASRKNAGPKSLRRKW